MIAEGSVLQSPFPTNHMMTGLSLTKVGVSQFPDALWRYSFPRWTHAVANGNGSLVQQGAVTEKT